MSKESIAGHGADGVLTTSCRASPPRLNQPLYILPQVVTLDQPKLRGAVRTDQSELSSGGPCSSRGTWLKFRMPSRARVKVDEADVRRVVPFFSARVRQRP